MRAIALVIESTNALKQVSGQSSLANELASLLSPSTPIQAATKAPGAILKLSSDAQNFPPATPDGTDSIEDTSDEPQQEPL